MALLDWTLTAGMAYSVHVWHQYFLQRPGGHTAPLTVNPGAAVAAVVCLFLIACWAAYQVQSRCGSCGAIPARCHCDQ
jgi:hypothetical protein